MFTKASNAAAGQATDPHAEATGEVITFGDFRIDLTARTATLCGRELGLTFEKFDVLVFLTSHPRSLVTPHTTLATSWAAKRVRQVRFLRALISLSGKLEAAAGPDKHYLQTEPWVVYRFDPTSASAP